MILVPVMLILVALGILLFSWAANTMTLMDRPIASFMTMTKT